MHGTVPAGGSTPAWIHFCPTLDGAARDAVLASLAGAGLQPRRPGASPGRYGVIVSGGVDEPALDLVRETGGAARVLVLLVGAAACAPQDSWRALAAGAADVVQWTGIPAADTQVRARIERWQKVEQLAESPPVASTLVGASAAWRSLVLQVVEIAAYSQSAVLVVGESGTGKELLAQLIHALDTRKDKGELVVVDCTTVAAELSGSEFFGHERGAYTGATGQRDGAFALADGGTLFLDEIGDLPLPLQAQLLRVIQEGKYKRLGANHWQHTRFRLVAATHRDLEAGVAAGTFRADLYHRIAGWVCRTPPLRERMDDVLVLARHFQAEFCRGNGCDGFDEAVCQYLTSRDYPGNVRDLRRLVARLCHRHAGAGPVTVGDVPVDERPAAADAARPWQSGDFEEAIRRAVNQGVCLKEIGRVAEDVAIRFALEHEQDSLPRAAKWLDVNPRTLQMRRAAGH